MSLSDFLDKPWKKSHRAYETSAFSMQPAPEFATAEVVLASLYRSIGFSGVSEGSVPQNGRRLEKSSVRDSRGSISNDTWNTLLKSIIDSPKQPKQSAKRFLSLSPLVPEACLYSGSARLQGNPWNPGILIQQIIRSGSASEADAALLWHDLFDSLSVNEGDDIWAIWLRSEFKRRSVLDEEWAATDLIGSLPLLPAGDLADIRYPARRIVNDLRAVISAKDSMTRRQWISLLEAVLRLGSVSHALWVCRINDRLWRSFEARLLGQAGAQVPSAREARDSIFMGEGDLLTYGNHAVPRITNIASSYCSARLGINLVLWALESIGETPASINSSEDVVRVLDAIDANREKLLDINVIAEFRALRDRESRTISCKKNIGSNIVEFCRHTLGQRQTMDELLRGYDQGYFLRKRSESKSAPWIVGFGPVAVLAMAHCALHKAAGPRSIQHLVGHMRWYGLEIFIDHIVSGDLGLTLRQLGLVLDSPDAESGMLLERPFSQLQPGSPA